MNQLEHIDYVDMAILSELATKPLHFNELARRLKGLCSRRTLQRRLRVLMDVGILSVRINGQYKFYYISDNVLSAGVRLLSMLSKVAEVIAVAMVPNETILNEMNIVFTIADITWYYVWFIYMTKRDIGRILLTMLVERYWPSLFSLLLKYIARKGIDLEKALQTYASKLLNALEDLRIEATKRACREHKELLHELITALVEAYRALVATTIS